MVDPLFNTVTGVGRAVHDVVSSWVADRTPTTADVHAHLDYLNRLIRRYDTAAGATDQFRQAIETVHIPDLRDDSTAIQVGFVDFTTTQLTELAGILRRRTEQLHEEREAIQSIVARGRRLFEQLQQADRALDDANRALHDARREAVSNLSGSNPVEAAQQAIEIGKSFLGSGSGDSAVEQARRAVVRAEAQRNNLIEQWFGLLASHHWGDIPDPGHLDNRAWKNADLVDVTALPNFTLFPSNDEAWGDDVLQGSIGNCWLIAAIYPLTQDPEGRQLLRDMIVDNGDGTFTVTFPGYGPVIVDGHLPMNGDRIMTTGNDGLPGAYWFALLQKAFAQIDGSVIAEHHEEALVMCIPGLTGHTNDGYEATVGGFATTAFNLLGIPSTRYFPSDFDDFAERITSVNDGHLATWSVDMTVFAVKGAYEGRHAFSVLSVDDSQDPAMVLVRNPWGHNAALSKHAKDLGVTDLGDGVIAMPIDAAFELATAYDVTDEPLG